MTYQEWKEWYQEEKQKDWTSWYRTMYQLVNDSNLSTDKKDFCLNGLAYIGANMTRGKL